MEKKECWYVVWRYEFRTGVFMTLTSLAKELKISYWTLYRVFRKEGQIFYEADQGIEIHRTFVYR